jgi:hypothetical protein
MAVEVRSRSGKYQEVADTSESDNYTKLDKKRRSFIERLQVRGFSLLWLLASVALIVYAELHSITSDPRFHW